MKYLGIPLCLALFACGEDDSKQVLTLTAKSDQFSIIVSAKGELKSASEVVVSAPSSVRGNLTLSWLKEENSLVEKDEVIARFDGEQNMIRRDQAQLELEKIQLSQSNTEQTLKLDQFSIEQEAKVISSELQMTDRFTSGDLSIYSKNEIIDQFLNKEFLTAKDQYLDWSKDSKTEQGTAQLDLLSLQGKSHSQTIAIQQNALNQLEVKAPQSGILIHSKNWRGEKVREGSSMWPGSKIASIPSLDKMQAKIFVLETEAAGITAGQKVELILDAYPNQTIKGSVNKISSIAAPKKQNSPVKYFEVIADIDVTDSNIMKPGQKLSADIILHKQDRAISVPNQVIFEKDGESWVYVKNGSGFKKQVVELGKRSLTKSSLVKGVNEGDEIALVEPDMESKS